MELWATASECAADATANIPEVCSFSTAQHNTTQQLIECKPNTRRMPRHCDNRASSIDFKDKIPFLAGE